MSTSGCIGIDKHLLGVGRRHAGTQVTVIRRHRQIAVFASNQLIAEFTLTGRRGYQAKNARSVTEVLRHMCHRCPETSQVARLTASDDVPRNVIRTRRPGDHLG